MKIIGLKIIPSAVIVRQTCTKVLTAYRDVKKIRRVSEVFLHRFRKRNTINRGLNMKNIESTVCCFMSKRETTLTCRARKH